MMRPVQVSELHACASGFLLGAALVPKLRFSAGLDEAFAAEAAPTRKLLQRYALTVCAGIRIKSQTKKEGTGVNGAL